MGVVIGAVTMTVVTGIAGIVILEGMVDIEKGQGTGIEKMMTGDTLNTG